MAILISVHYPRSRFFSAYCYHSSTKYIGYGNDALLTDRHEVEVERGSSLRSLGWGYRQGRLPICPEHRLPDDDPYPESG